MKLYGSLTAISFSPIVTIEPRRRKFHRTIELRMPLPSSYSHQTEDNLRLLCSIEEGQNRAEWKDMTDSIKPLAIDSHHNCLIFPTTISARYWLVHGQQQQQQPRAGRAGGSSVITQLRAQAAELYRYLICVPFMAKFVIFAKRRDINEANIRVFCMTDDKEERTLEVQEHYTQVAKSRDVEVVDGQTMYLEFGGNLVPASYHQHQYRTGGSNRWSTSSAVLLNEQLAFDFRAFQENRLAFAVRLKEVGQDASGRIAFVEDSMRYLSSLNAQQRQYFHQKARRAICTLGLALPQMCVNYDNILGTPKRNSYYASARIGDLTLADVAALLDEPSPGSQPQDGASSLAGYPDSLHEDDVAMSSDWLELAPKLGIPRDEVEFIINYCRANQIGGGRQQARVSPALILLMHWYKLASPDERDQDLARALTAIGRADIAQKLNFPIEPKKMSRSTMELLREIELIPVRSTENIFLGPELYDRPRGGSELGGFSGDSGEGSRGASRLRSSSRSAMESGGPAASESSGGGRLLSQRSRTEINVPSSDLMETRVSTREWTQEKNGTLSHMVEQTAFVEAKPRDGSSKKQRRRKSGVDGIEGPQQPVFNAKVGIDRVRLVDSLPNIETSDVKPSPQTTEVATIVGGEGLEEEEQQQQQEIVTTVDDDNELGYNLARKFQTADHAQAPSCDEAHANSMGAKAIGSGCDSESALVKAGEDSELKLREEDCNASSSGGDCAVAKRNNPLGTRERAQCESMAAAAVEKGAQALVLEALESSLSELFGRRNGSSQTIITTAAASVASAAAELADDDDEGRRPYTILEHEQGPPNNPDLDNHDTSSYAEGAYQEEEEFSNFAVGCATAAPAAADVGAPSAAAQLLESGLESGDFGSVSTTTDEDTTIIAAAPAAAATKTAARELNVNVRLSSTAAAQEQYGNSSLELGEEELFRGSFCSLDGHEGFTEELIGDEGAESELADLDSSERTAGWGCGERVMPETKFKDTTTAGAAATTPQPSPTKGSQPFAEATTIKAAAICAQATHPVAAADTGARAAAAATTEPPPKPLASAEQPILTGDDGGQPKPRPNSDGSEIAADIPTPEIAGRYYGDLESGPRAVGCKEIIASVGIETKQAASDGASSAVTTAAADEFGQLPQLGYEEGPKPPQSQALAIDGGVEKFKSHQAAATHDGVTNSEALMTTSAGTILTTTTTTTPSKLAPNNSSEERDLRGTEAVGASVDLCTQVASGTAPHSSPAAISSKYQPPPTHSSSSGGQQQQQKRISRTQALVLDALASPSSSSASTSSSSTSTKKQRPKSELIIKRRSSQTRGQLEYCAAAELDSEPAYLHTSQPVAGSSSSSSQDRSKSNTALDQQDWSSHSSSQAADLQSSSSYTTAPLGQLPTASSSSAADFVTVSTSLSLYETARSSLTATPNNDSSRSSSISVHDENNTTSEMVSFSIEDRTRSLSQGAASASDADTPTMTPNTEELEDMDVVVGEDDNIEQPPSTPTKSSSNDETMKLANPGSSSQQQSAASASSRQNSDEIIIDDSIDEEQLRRILTCKRLSEGCNRFGSNFVARKNSLHMIEELPPLTEGETMKHMSYHHSQTIDQSTASSSSSGSLRVGAGRPQNLLRELAMKRGSQDENTSCSSSTSLERSPTRRRSSTVSQCSSVLSESTRNQLNFDLSPDLPPDSSLLEANAISPTTDLERPASPEPSSFSGEAYDFRPISRMSHDELILPSPDSTLGDSNDNEAMEEQLGRLTQSCCQHQQPQEDMELSNESENNQLLLHYDMVNRAKQQDVAISEHLEQIISDVSTVAVTKRPTSSKRPASDDPPSSSCSGQVLSFGQKSARSSIGCQDVGERRSSLVRPPTPIRCSRAQTDSPESPIRDRDRVIRPQSVATNQPTSHRSNNKIKSSLGQRSRTMNTPSPSANSTCSSTSSHSSSGATTRGNRSMSMNLNQNRNNDDYRLLHVIELERKDSRLRQQRQPPSFRDSDTWNRKADGTASLRRPVPTGHRHTNLESGPLCYCHNL